MKFGASTFINNINELLDIVDSIEFYIPKLNLYKNRLLQRDKLNELLDFRYSYNINSTMHAPYYPGKDNQYPLDLVINLTKMNKSDKILFKEIIDIAVKFDVSLLTVHPGIIINNNKEKSIEKMTKNLNEIVKYAMDSDILIGLENKEATDKLTLGTTSKELIDIINSINNDNIGIVFDIGHANLTCNGNQKKLEKYFEDLKKYIIHFHIHDNFGVDNGKYNGDLHLCPGDGNINYMILKDMKNKDIIFNFELFNLNDIIKGKNKIKDILNNNLEI